MKTILTRKELAERWGVAGTTIDRYEREGHIKKLFNGGYSLSSIEALEYDGIDNLIIQKDREIRQLKLELLDMKNIIAKLKLILSNH